MDNYDMILEVTITTRKDGAVADRIEHFSIHDDGTPWTELVRNFLSTLRGAGFVLNTNTYTETVEDMADEVTEAEATPHYVSL